MADNMKTHTEKLLQAVLFLSLSCVFTQNPALRDFCETEMFSATCADSEVILIQSARYGRMRLGRCVRKDLGYIGCYTDVVHLTDKRCSGRRTCQIRIPDPEFDLTRPCLEELKTYFEVTYVCQKVWLPDGDCKSKDRVIISATSGTLASHVTSELGCGSPSHPYIIRAQPGQQVNLSLIDFMADSTSGGHDFNDDGHCRAYGVFVDTRGKRREVICGGRTRVRNVYVSKSHELELRITPSSEDSLAYYIFAYEVIGCADLDVTSDAWVQRTQGGAVVGCRDSEQKWNLKCVGATWTGMIGNCSHYGGFESDTHNSPPARLPYGKVWGTSIMVILGIAFFIGVVVFIIGFILFKRCPKKPPANKRRVPTYIRGDSANAMVEMDDKNRTLKRKSNDNIIHSPGCRLAKMEGNDYAHIWETTLPLTHAHTVPREFGENSTIKSDRCLSQPEICPLETNLDLLQPSCEHRADMTGTMPRLKHHGAHCDMQHPRYFVLDKESVFVEDPSSCTHLLHQHNVDGEPVTFIPNNSGAPVQPSHVDLKPHQHPDLAH